MNDKPTVKKRFKMRPMLLVLLGFIIVMLVGAFLLALPASNVDGKWLEFDDAVFTASSAVCVTGLIIHPTAMHFTVFGQVILLLLIQIGGLGIMTLATLIFILIRKRITLKDRVALQEALGQDHIKGVVRLVRAIAATTGIIELAGMLLLMPFFCVKNGGIGVWQALFVSVSAFCNAGFDILGTAQNPYASLTDFNGNAGVLLIVAILITLGGLGFNVIRDTVKNKFRFKRLSLHTKIVLVVSLLLFLFGTFFFLGSEFGSSAYQGMNGGEKLLNSMFQSVTARTAGFNAVDQNAMSNTGKIATCFLMFIGAAPGGTGGGIKVTTFAVTLLMAISGLSGKEDIVIAKCSVKSKTGYRSVSITVFAALLIMLVSLIVSAVERTIPTGNIVFDVISAFATVGLSSGICPALSVFSKLMLVTVMFVGKLGPLSIGMIFAKRENISIKYPIGQIMIG